MRANRRTDTKPELALRHALHRLGYRYRKDYRLDLDGGRRVRPDIAFTARKVAVFVDGCFWHACPEHGSKPRANEWYWGPKLIKNVERDRVNDAALILAGWTVVRLWEHVPLDEAVGTVVTALTATVARRPSRPSRHGRTPEANPARHRRFAWLARRRLWQTLGHHARVPAFDAPGAGRGPPGRKGRPGPGRVGHAEPSARPQRKPDPGQQPGYAVTPALREAYASGDEEELEYAALTEAARASLRMLAGNPAAPPRRVVLAAEIPADGVKLDARDREPGRVLVTAAIPIDKLASAHVDDVEAGTDVRAAAEALDAADAGDEDARFAVDGAEGHELAWYATQELSYLAE